MNKQILDFLQQEKLGQAVLPPFSEFSGIVAAKVKRNGSEAFVASKWNPDTNAPDIAYDPEAFKGSISEFVCLYEQTGADEEKVEESVGEVDLRTNKELDALLLSLGADEKVVKYLPNKDARVKLLKELEEKDLDKE